MSKALLTNGEVVCYDYSKQIADSVFFYQNHIGLVGATAEKNIVSISEEGGK